MATLSTKVVIMSSSNHSDGSSSQEAGKLAPASATSGYSADGSAAATKTDPPVYIDFLNANKNKKDGGSKQNGDDDTCQSRSNRRKSVELSFTASRALEDLKKGGLPIPTIRSEDVRDLEGHKINMSKVKLVKSMSVSESPFLIDRSDVDFVALTPTSECVYHSLFAAAYQSYEKHDPSQWDSSTSSVTSSESDDVASMPPPALVIRPLLEDAIKAALDPQGIMNPGKIIAA